MARPPRCVCGADYADLRTGLTFREVRRLMWIGGDDTSRWRYKRRRQVLGFWHELKLQLWWTIHGYCE